MDKPKRLTGWAAKQYPPKMHPAFGGVFTNQIARALLNNGCENLDEVRSLAADADRLNDVLGIGSKGRAVIREVLGLHPPVVYPGGASAWERICASQQGTY